MKKLYKLDGGQLRWRYDSEDRPRWELCNCPIQTHVQGAIKPFCTEECLAFTQWEGKQAICDNEMEDGLKYLCINGQSYKEYQKWGCSALQIEGYLE